MHVLYNTYYTRNNIPIITCYMKYSWILVQNVLCCRASRKHHVFAKTYCRRLFWFSVQRDRLFTFRLGGRIERTRHLSRADPTRRRAERARQRVLQRARCCFFLCRADATRCSASHGSACTLACSLSTCDALRHCKPCGYSSLKCRTEYSRSRIDGARRKSKT